MTKLYIPNADELRGARPQDSKLWYPNNKLLLLDALRTNEGRDAWGLNFLPYPVMDIGPGYVTEDLAKDAGPGVKRTSFYTSPIWSNRYRANLPALSAVLKRMAFEQMRIWPELGARPRLTTARFTTTTFFPDPDTETDTVDGWIREDTANETWATKRDHTAGTLAADSTTDQAFSLAAGTTTDRWSNMARFWFLFLTSSLGSDILDSGTFEFVLKDALSNDFTGSISFITTTPASNTGLVTGDFDQVGSTKQATDVTFASLNSDDSTYNPMTLIQAGLDSIDKAGVSKFGARETADADNAEPTWGSGDSTDQNIRLADNAGSPATIKDPKLVMVHSAPVTPQAYAAYNFGRGYRRAW